MESFFDGIINATDKNLAAIFIVFAVFALGDFISYKTKSYVSMLLAAALIFLMLFWTGLPKEIFDDSGLVLFATAIMGISITNMGTIIDFAELKRQWKTMVVAVVALIGIILFSGFVGSLIVGKAYAFSSAGPISGGIVAAIIVGEKFANSGLANADNLIIFATMLVSLQAFVGYPLASIMLKKEATKIKNMLKNGEEIVELKTKDNVDETKKLLKPLPEKLQTTSIIILKIGFVAMISFALSKLFAGFLPPLLQPHRYVICILLGIVAYELGFLEKNALIKANAQGLIMVSILVFAVRGLSEATPEVLASIIVPTIVTLILGGIGVIIAGFISAKIVNISPTLAIAIGASAMIGFPGTFILSNEIANSESTTEQEKEAILAVILPKMVIGGFVTVTVGSVIVVSILMNMI